MCQVATIPMTATKLPGRIRARHAFSAIDAGVLALVTVTAFWPVFRNAFLNWDDPAVLVNNPRLGAPGVVVLLACYAASLLLRASAIGFPIALLLVDIYPLARHRRASLGRLALEKVPFVVLATSAVFAESRARDIASFQEVGIGARLTM